MTTSSIADEGGALLQLRGLTKSFGGALALDNVDLTVFPGEVHGLLGENGSGKSTLIKILAGYYEPEAGSLTVRGTDVDLPLKVGEYRALGFEFVHQDLGLIPSLSVTENLYLREIASPRNRLFISWRQAAAKAAQTFERYGIRIDPHAAVQDIRPVERALLAIVRALEGLSAEHSRADGQALLVLDEPTVFLPQHEVAILFDFVRAVARRGSSVLFVSHDLDEVHEITDRITVLRDGRVSGTVVTSESEKPGLVRLIIGRELEDLDWAGAATLTDHETVLRVEHLNAGALSDINLELHAGEVLGLTGLVGSGYEDIIYSMYGAVDATSGTLAVDGQRLAIAEITPRKAMAAGLALVPGDRQRDGSIPTLSASDNLNLLVLDHYFRAGRLRQGDLQRNARSLMQAYDVRPPLPELDYGSLSGGNQQKALMAKWQQTKPRVMLLHEPTQGVDVGARQQIWEMIRSSTSTTAVICASSDYEQLAAICDRVLVVARGRLVGVITGSDLTKERIGDFCLSTTGSPELVATQTDHVEPTSAAAKG
jgi:ribose transport system ATP-binding protein